jgi:hypothetical protein
MIGSRTKKGHFKDSKKNIRMETNGEPTTGKTETEVVGWCVWQHKGAESEKMEGISNGQESLEWLVWESQNPQRVVVLMEEEEVIKIISKLPRFINRNKYSKIFY